MQRVTAAAALYLAGAGVAQAHTCYINNYTNIVNFGMIDSSLSHTYSVPATLTIKCDGLDPNTPAKYCAMVYPYYPDIDKKAAAGYRHIWNAGSVALDHVDFNFTADGNIFGAGTDNNDYGETIIGSTYTDSGIKYYTLPLEAAIAAGQGSVKTGTYLGYYSFQVNYNYIDKDVTDADLCKKIPKAPTSRIAPVLLTVRADVKPACTIQKQKDINFGPAIDLNKLLTNTGQMTITCAEGVAYQIGINEGRNADTGGSRNMRCDAGAICGSAQVQYGLFQDSAYTMPWTDEWNTDGVVKKTGTGLADSVNIYGRVVPGQQTPPAGRYTDSVVISVFQN